MTVDRSWKDMQNKMSIVACGREEVSTENKQDACNEEEVSP